MRDPSGAAACCVPLLPSALPPQRLPLLAGAAFEHQITSIPALTGDRLLQGTQVVFSKLGAEAAFEYMTAVFRYLASRSSVDKFSRIASEQQQLWNNATHLTQDDVENFLSLVKFAKLCARVALYPSHVTRHTSHVTRHTSHNTSQSLLPQLANQSTGISISDFLAGMNSTDTNAATRVSWKYGCSR